MSFIITQKENKGEYGGNWTHSDQDIYAHIFDQTDSSGTPYRYTSATSSGACPSADIENSTTLTNRATGLYGNNNQKISNQVECKPNTLNAGNYYNFPAATAGSDNHSVKSDTETLNSICPKGWRLPPNAGDKSYNTLIRTAYQIADGPSGSVDSNLLGNSAMSFVRLGIYDYGSGSSYNRGNGGSHWSSTAYSATASRRLVFDYAGLSPQSNYGRARGFSLRCVSR